MASISLCMIVRDEERNLPPCLKSMEGLADEIIVVDTGSRDKTMEIAGSFGARLFEFTWCDDFSAARNFSLSKATKDYVFWMDADDRLPPMSKKLFLALKRQLSGEEDPLALFFTIKSSFCENEGIKAFKQIRLFPRRPGLSFQGKIHEQIIPSLVSEGVLMKHVDIEILHEGYKDKAKRIEKAKRNLAILDKEDPTPINLIYRANMLEAIGRRDDAIEVLHRALSGKEDLLKYEGWYEKGVADLVAILIKEGRTERAGEILKKGIENRPDSFRLLMLMGEIMLDQGYTDQGFDYLEKAAAHTQDIGTVEGMSHKNVARLFVLTGKCRFDSGNSEGAMQAYSQALKWLPGDESILKGMRSMARTFEHEEKFEEAADILAQILHTGSLKDRIHRMMLYLNGCAMDKFTRETEEVMNSLGIETDREIRSQNDLALLLLQIAEAIPEQPGRPDMIELIRDGVLNLSSQYPA